MSTNQPVKTPLGAELMKEPGVSAWFQNVKPLTDKLTGVPDALSQMMNTYSQQVISIEGNTQLSPPGKMAQRQELANTTLQKIDALQQDAQKAIQTLEDRINGTLSPANTSASDLLLQEAQITRAWQRIKGVLDTMNDPGMVLRRVSTFAEEAVRAVGQTGRPVIYALKQELPAYLEARKMNLGEQMQEIIVRAELPLLSPVQRAAMQLAFVCEGGWARLLIAFDQARGAVQRGGGQVALPGFYVPERMQF